MMSRSAVTLVLAFATVYFFWGTTHTAMRLAVATLPPFEMAGIRLLIAGLMVWLFVRLRGVPLPTRRAWLEAALVGFVLLVLGNAMYAWTLQTIPSGIGSLIMSLSPLWMAIIAFVVDRERIAPLGLLGIILGLCGIAYLAGPQGELHLSVVPTLIAVGASLAWAAGTLLQRRFSGTEMVQASGMQMIAAGALALVIAPLLGERVVPSHVRPEAIGAVVYLIVFGSLVSYTAYMWIFQNVGTTLASTYAYVNPIVALDRRHALLA